MPELHDTRWRMPDSGPPADWQDLGRDLSIPGPGLRVLWNRGLRTRDEVRRFLDPAAQRLGDPFLLPDALLAVERLHQAIRDGEGVVCIGDSDVDGITSAALLTLVLRRLGGRVEPRVPDRMRQGFGLTPSAAERAHLEGAGLIVTVDCGSSDNAGVARASELGVDVVVLDHHVPTDPAPAAAALVNPRRTGAAPGLERLAAVGVVFKVLQALVSRHFGEEARDFLFEQADLAALGTVSDAVPLTGENRILVSLGLGRIRERPRPALVALIRAAGLEDRWLDASHLSYFLVPRVNASGRLGAPERSLRLLVCEDPAEARILAGRVEEDNTERRHLNERVLHEALVLLEGAGGAGRATREPIVLGSCEWHPGVLGIAATKLAQRFARPVLLVALSGETARGSARAAAPFDLLSWIGRAGAELTAFGGHPQAAGISLPPGRFAGLREALLAPPEGGWDAAGAPPSRQARVDGELDPCACDLDLARWLERLAPFGAGNPEPVFYGTAFCRGVRVQDGRHLRLRAGDGARSADCIGFGLGRRASEIPRGGAMLEMIYEPIVNRFRGEERVQLKVRDFRPRGDGAPLCAADAGEAAGG